MGYVSPPTYTVSFLFRRILIPYDGSDNSRRALDIAIDFAKRYGSKLVVLIVEEAGIDTEKLTKFVKELASREGVKIDVKTRKPNIYSSIANEILREIIEGGYDLVILGARGNTINEELLIGSTALATIINAPISVMVVR
ncbi:MAG TPA: universal stress protein [Pyrodictium sp.]|nr:universal stress protein [Pyrodictium sp.]